MTDKSDIVERLEAQAREIASAGHAGWGNTMTRAATAHTDTIRGECEHAVPELAALGKGESHG